MPNKNKLSTDSFGSVIHTPFVWVKRNLGAMVALALMCILLSVTTDSFLVSTNILSTLRNVCVNCLIAFGITCVLICGGIDLSVGSVVGLVGMLAGGIGSALSDLIGGYFVYVPITLVIKGLVALVSGLIYQKMCRYGKNRYVAVILGGITDIVFVAGGYFICEFFLYGSGAAASIPANIIQGVGGLIISAVLYPVLIAIPDVRQAAYETKN